MLFNNSLRDTSSYLVYMASVYSVAATAAHDEPCSNDFNCFFFNNMPTMHCFIFRSSLFLENCFEMLGI